MVLTLKEVKPQRDHLLEQIETRVKVALKKKARYGALALGLAVVITTQPRDIPFTHFHVAAGIEDVTRKAVRSMTTLQTQLLILSKYGLLIKKQTNYCNEYYINFELLPEGDL